MTQTGLPPAQGPSPTQPVPGPAQYDPSSLQNTLLAMAIQGLSQATSQEDQNNVHAQVQEAQRQMQQAGQQYTQAVQQPAQAAPYNFYDQLAGNVASVLTKNPDYQQQAHERLQNQQTLLAQNRLQNLQALKDQYDQKAQIAERLGNAEIGMQSRLKSEQIMKNMDAIIRTMHEQAATGRNTATNATRVQTTTMNNQTSSQNNAATNATSRANNLTTNSTRLATAGLTSAGAGADDMTAGIKALVVHTPWGDVIDQSKLKGVADNRAARKIAADNNIGLVSPREFGALQDMQSSIETLKHQAQQIRPYLAASGDPTSIGQQWLTNKAKQFGGDPVLRSWDSMWANTVRTLRAQAGSGGLRINKSEIDRAINWDRPNWRTDSQPILDQKMQNWQIMAQNAMNPIVSRDWTSVKNNKVTVMDPSGKTSVVPAPQVDDLVKKGYARVLTRADVDPRLKQAAVNRLLDEVTGGTGGAGAGNKP